jgi:CubicO group peptidase (beta-lactamase class C family)
LVKIQADGGWIVRLTAAFLLLLALASPLLAQTEAPSVATVPAPDDLHEIREMVVGRVASGEAPSMAVAVVRDGRLVWEEAFGWADVETAIPATPETIYAVGSLSKSMTATGIMVLVERGVIALDDPVDEYLPPRTITIHEGQSADLTIRRVLQMRGGIPHGWATYSDAFDPPTITEYLETSGVVVFEPGAVELYSNNSYGVLEAVIEGATGRDFADFMRSDVFEPLGMHNSFAALTPELVELAAARYASTGERLPYSQSHFIPQGGAGGYMSVHDLAMYAQFHLGSPASGQSAIMSSETLEKMHYEKAAEDSESIFAFGWGSVALEDDLHWLVTNGSISGGISMLTLVPEKGVAVAVLANLSSRSLADETAVMIADAAVPGFARRAMAFMQAYEEARAPVPFEPGPELRGEWRGSLDAGESNVSVSVTLNADGGATVRFGDDDPVAITDLMLTDGRMSASFSGRLPGHPVFGEEHSMELTLRSGGSALYGYVTSGTTTDAGGMSIPFYLRLGRSP